MKLFLLHSKGKERKQFNRVLIVNDHKSLDGKNEKNHVIPNNT